MPHARTEWAAGMEAQYVINIGGQCCELDATGFGKIPGGKGARDRLSFVPEGERSLALARYPLSPGVGSGRPNL